MSTWHVTAIERLGAPDATWPSIYGPVAGADPIAANALRTLDLTPYLEPLKDFTAQLERDLTTSSYSSMNLDLADADGTLAEALGPFSTTLATATRYFGPWIQVWEEWTGGSALRFLGYVDETSLQWSEDDAKTQASVIHASQLLHERLITDYPSLLRPWPSVPTGGILTFIQSTADALLQATDPAYVPRNNANALEAALWAMGQLSWETAVQQTVHSYLVSGEQMVDTVNYSAPLPPADDILIGGHSYAVNHVDWDSDISATLTGGTSANNHSITYGPARIYLQGAPNLTGILSLGTEVTWDTPAAQATHYLLSSTSIPAPAAGSDGVDSIQLNTVEGLVVGDVLTLTFVDATSGAPRKTTVDLPPIVDVDGETGQVFLATPLTQGYTSVSKIRRNSQDPVLFDGVAYAKALVAPFSLSTLDFVPAPTDIPQLQWQPYDTATPSLYGVFHLHTLDQGGTLRAVRRGSDNGTGQFLVSGVWTGAWGGAWAWLGLPSVSATHEIYGDVLQWPGGVNPYSAPVIYINGDLSSGATIPPNGWRSAWRTFASPLQQSQSLESSWTGSGVLWSSTAPVGDVPSVLLAFAASTPTPGLYGRSSSGAWSFRPHTGNATLGTSVTPTISGTLPTGSWLALGMGILASGDEHEALLGLVATGTAFPFSAVTAVVLSQAAGGGLTVQQSQQLWPPLTGSIPAGPWALGGGLAVQVYTETLDGLQYPRTVLHKLNGTGWITADLKTLEVIPQTLCPLLLTGTAGARTIGGWYALAIETYADSSYAARRRLRFLHLDANLAVLNGDLEPDPAIPGDVGSYFSRGELVASVVPPGALVARMVRDSNTQDSMTGLFGGRLFRVGKTLATTVEYLKIGATAPAATPLDVSYSGDGMTASDYLEKFAAAMVATAIPHADGGLSLVSRSAGTLRVRTIGTQAVSVQASERSKRTKTQLWQGYIRKVRVKVSDRLSNGISTVEESGTFAGGRILEFDMSDLLCSIPMGRAIARACVFWFGIPAAVLAETWVDRTLGTQSDMGAPFWADWQIGDLITFDAYDPLSPTPITVHKLLKLQPAVEERAVQVELRQQPFSMVAP